MRRERAVFAIVFAIGITVAVISSIAACGLSVVGSDPLASDDHSEASLPDAFVGATTDGDFDVGSASSSTSSSTSTSSSSSGDAMAKGDAQCPDTGACTRIMFLSSAKYDGALGGVAGADAKCGALAKASSIARVKNGAFAAWIGATGASPASRFDKRGSFIRTDNEVIAKSWQDLVDGSIQIAIEYDENGVKPNNDDDTWSGVDDNGTFSATTATCADWTSNVITGSAPNGFIGLATRTDSTWTSARVQLCNVPTYLYCIEL